MTLKEIRTPLHGRKPAGYLNDFFDFNRLNDASGLEPDDEWDEEAIAGLIRAATAFVAPDNTVVVRLNCNSLTEKKSRRLAAFPIYGDAAVLDWIGEEMERTVSMLEHPGEWIMTPETENYTAFSLAEMKCAARVLRGEDVSLFPDEMVEELKGEKYDLLKTEAAAKHLEEIEKLKRGFAADIDLKWNGFASKIATKNREIRILTESMFTGRNVPPEYYRAMKNEREKLIRENGRLQREQISWARKADKKRARVVAKAEKLMKDALER